MSGFRARSIGRLRPYGLGGEPGTGEPESAPSNTTSTAESDTPARSRTSLSETPAQIAVLTAPPWNLLPLTGGSRSTRLLPAHSMVTGTVRRGIPSISA